MIELVAKHGVEYLFTDLAIAVAAGVIISALVFAWKSGKHVKIHSYVNERGIGVHNLHDLKGSLHPILPGESKSLIEGFFFRKIF